MRCMGVAHFLDSSEARDEIAKLRELGIVPLDQTYLQLAEGCARHGSPGTILEVMKELEKGEDNSGFHRAMVSALVRAFLKWLVEDELIPMSIGSLCMYTHTHTHTHTHTYIHTHTHIHIYTHMHIHTCTHTTHIHTYTCTYTRTHKHTLTCTYTHTLMHTHTQVVKLRRPLKYWTRFRPHPLTLRCYTSWRRN